MATLMAALDDGKEFHLYASESRPHFLGRRTARQLADRDGADVTLIVDGAVGHYLSEADRVFVGMNCLIDDVVYNRSERSRWPRRLRDGCSRDRRRNLVTVHRKRGVASRMVFENST